jgi:hypothetical protein
LDVWLGESRSRRLSRRPGCPRQPCSAAMPDVTDTNGAAVPDGEGPPKPKRGKPNDEHAPLRPKSAFQKWAATARVRLKEGRPELLTDIRGMAKALAEEWGKFPEEEKARMTGIYEEEMEIWKPKWAAYKETPHYKEFFEVKQDWIDKRARKKLRKKMNANAPKRVKSGYMLFASEHRERIMKNLKGERPDIGDCMKRISLEWQELLETAKAKYSSAAIYGRVPFSAVRPRPGGGGVASALDVWLGECPRPWTCGWGSRGAGGSREDLVAPGSPVPQPCLT